MNVFQGLYQLFLHFVAVVECRKHCKFFLPVTDSLYSQLAPSVHTHSIKRDGAFFFSRKLGSLFIWVLRHQNGKLAHQAQHADPALQPRDGGSQRPDLCLRWEFREQCFWPSVEFLRSLWSCHRNVCMDLRLYFTVSYPVSSGNDVSERAPKEEFSSNIKDVHTVLNVYRLDPSSAP